MGGDRETIQIESGGDSKLENKSQRNTKGRSRLLVSLVLPAILLITTIVFVALFVFTYNKSAYQALLARQLCNTPDCVAAAGRMIRQMNVSADPCVDFNEFACGRYIRETLIPDGSSSVDTTVNRDTQNLLIVKGILAEGINEGEPSYLTDMKHKYRTCMENVEKDEDDLQFFLNHQLVKDWPTINKSWSRNIFQLSTAIIRYMAVDVTPLFSIHVQNYDNNPTMKQFFLDQPKLGLPREYFLRPRNDTVIMAYQQYLKDIAVQLGASLEVADEDTKDVVDLEIALAKISPTKEEEIDHGKLNNPHELYEFSALYPELGVADALRTFAIENNFTVTDNVAVIDQFPAYMGNIAPVIKDFSSRTIMNLFGFQYAILEVVNSNSPLRTIQMAFDKIYMGQIGEIQHWEKCVNEVAISHEKEIEAEFVARILSDAIKPDIKEIFSKIKDTFKQIVVENTWISQVTKEQIYKKVAAIKLNIIDPSSEKQVQESEAMAQQQPSLANETDEASRNTSEEPGAALQRPSHTRRYLDIPAYGTSADFDPTTNTLYVTPGMLLPPFFSKQSQDYINYGAIGTVIGQEFNYGFDVAGIHYDEKGNFRNWWKPSDKNKFRQRMQCIIDQTSAFYVEEIKMNLNGLYTQRENLAVISGLKHSFRAYKEKVSKKGEEKRLPVLNLTPDQLFFLSFGQALCEKKTKEATTYLVNTDMRLPARYRTIITLQNSEDFAKAYDCPRGSYMNPEKKCDLW